MDHLNPADPAQKVDTSHPWPVTFWFGSWDGDLLTGWMQGSLGIPFLPDAASG